MPTTRRNTLRGPPHRTGETTITLLVRDRHGHTPDDLFRDDTRTPTGGSTP